MSLGSPPLCIWGLEDEASTMPHCDRQKIGRFRRSAHVRRARCLKLGKGQPGQVAGRATHSGVFPVPDEDEWVRMMPVIGISPATSPTGNSIHACPTFALARGAMTYRAAHREALHRWSTDSRSLNQLKKELQA